MSAWEGKSVSIQVTLQWDFVLFITAICTVLFLFPLNSLFAFSFYTIFSAFVSLGLCCRQMLYELSENITNEMLQEIVFLLRNRLPKRRRTTVCEKKAKCVYGREGMNVGVGVEWEEKHKEKSLWQNRSWSAISQVNIYRVNKKEGPSFYHVKLTAKTRFARTQSRW